MVQCRLDKEEIRAQLSNQAADRKAMHEENQLRFGKLERIIYIAMGVGATAATLGSHINLSRIFSP